MVFFALLMCCILGILVYWKGCCSTVCAVWPLSAQMEYLWKSAALVRGGGQGGTSDQRCQMGFFFSRHYDECTNFLSNPTIHSWLKSLAASSLLQFWRNKSPNAKTTERWRLPNENSNICIISSCVAHPPDLPGGIGHYWGNVGVEDWPPG